ncbi:20455_t:CDS:2 [Rhizophagus irregularis]|nr:20455_t:CDS:2 [Rhizophagus irregularis]
MIGNGQETENQNRDIILRSREDGIQQISEIHRAYAALHYHPNIPIHNNESTNDEDISEFSDENELNTSDKKSISAMNYVSYRLQVGRPEEAITLHYYGRLFQQ